MLKRYFSLCGLAGLLLAGCGRTEYPAEKAAASALASTPTAAASPPSPAATTLDELAARQPLAPTAEPKARLAPAPAGAAGRGRQARRPVKVLAQAQHQPGRLAATRPTVAQPAAADSVRLAELRSFMRAGLPAAQVFAVQPGRDTVLVGAQGTQVLVPANTFDVAAETAAVRLELQEFYTTADIVLAGLSTQAGPNLLETGGMLHLAATVAGQPVALRPGRRLALRLPARQPQPGMQLFEGVAHGTRRLDWQLPATNRPDTTLAKPRLLMQWPENKWFRKDMQVKLQALTLGKRRLRRNPLSTPRTRRELAALSEKSRYPIVRQLVLRFTIDSTGGLGKAEALPGSDGAFAPTALAALRQLTSWEPARLAAFADVLPVGEPTPATGQVHILFTKTHRILFEPISWSLPRTKRRYARQLRRTNDSLVARPSFRQRYWRAQDSLAYLRLLATQRRAEADQVALRAQLTDGSTAPITQDGVYNELRIQGLGWINCDRFAASRNLFVYQVQNSQPDAVVNLIFKNINCVMSGQARTAALTLFPNVPLDYPATVVALRRENGVTYLARHEVHLSDKPLAKLDFHPVTMAELRAALRR